MLAKKNRIPCGVIIFLILAFFIAGCTPPGPRAMLKGKKLLERGDYAAAVEQFKTATTLLSTNAQAWNYLGVASQRAGQPSEAVLAYVRALLLDRDLVEAHYNLGSLWLEQNKPVDAKTEFTAYTLRRSNDPEGWLKLGSAQLRLGDLISAEKSFGTAYYFNTNNAEALNGLGLVQVKRGHPREASQFFAAAVQYHPDYAPALLNLATVEQQDLRDGKLALQHYRAYLALTPRPANYDAVKALADSLESPAATVAATPPPVVQSRTAIAAPVVNEPKPVAVVRPVAEPKPQPVVSRKIVPSLPPRQIPSSPPAQMVKVQPEPVIVSSPNNVVPVATPTVNPASSPVVTQPSYIQNGVTPLPPTGSILPVAATPSATVKPEESKPVQVIQPAAPAFVRYLYTSPRKPTTGDRVRATGAFTKAQIFEQGAHWTDALQSYKQAAVYDPGWFEAQYNYGVLAYRLRNFTEALSAYEMALAIRPDSMDARYNFALALKAAGYPLDAVNELKKVVTANPNEVRAQLVLGNLYSQQLRDPARARPYYLKVLELEPRNSQANDIRFWLSTNPG